ncbi:MAG: family 20 glycosylhydrolase [Planctomycetaceae bacterium]|nr:family 20 glycosylhydrolase [Planctomycetaceae bacterium]
MFEKLLIPLKKVSLRKGFFRLTDSAVLKFYQDNAISNPEGYKIEILADGVEIFTATEAGSFYAIQTLKDLSVIYNDKLPCCVIEDWPDFKRRGVYLDCSRGKVPKLSTLKQLTERLARWKINELQLYIENVFTFKKHPLIGKGYSPFTPAEIIELREYCKKYHIKLVGSLASFGHFERILSLPKYQHLGELAGYRGLPGGTTLCPIDAGSIKLVSDLYSEFVPLFEAEDFNVCCDETWELGEGRSKKLADKIGKGEIYLQFLLKIHKLCQKYGKRMNVWADIVLKHPELLKKLPKDIVMLNWEYEQAGENLYRTKEIAKAGLPFMVCPGTSSWLTHGTRLANAMGNVANFAKQGRKFGAEGLLNTDWGDNEHRNLLGVSLHSFAHGAAHSWNGKAVDEEKFTQKFCASIFGQENKKIADIIKKIGSNYLTCGTNVPNRSWLYPALVEPVKNITPDSYIYKMSDKGLKKIIADSYECRYTGLPLQNFEKITLEEIQLAARMDVLAAKRALAIKNNKYSELRKLQKPFMGMADDFKKLWLIRNKPSRLKDNLKLFQQATEF